MEDGAGEQPPHKNLLATLKHIFDTRKPLVLVGILSFAIIIFSGSFLLGTRHLASLNPTPTPEPTMQVAPTEIPEPTEETEEVTPTPTRKPTPKPTSSPTSKPTSFSVTNVSLEGTPASGDCSTEFTFTATITANAAGKAKYKWEDKYGTAFSEIEVTFSESGNKVITDKWTPPSNPPLGSPTTRKIIITSQSPNLQASKDFTVTCPTPTPSPTNTPTPTPSNTPTPTP